MYARSTQMTVCALLTVIAVLCGAVSAHSMIIVTPRDGQSFPRSPVQLVEQKVDVNLTDRAAEVSVECVYHNSFNRDLEGEWIFPLPPEAAVDKFSMFVGGEEIKAELLDAATARNIYEAIVAKTRDPALLEYIDRQVLRARIFPILAGQDAAIKLYYTHPLTADFGVTDFVFPILAEDWSAERWNDPQVRVKSAMTLEIETVTPIKSVTCPTHDVDIDHVSEHHATVHGDASVLRQSGDFHLLCTFDNRDIAAQFLTTENEDGKFFMAIIAPGNGEGMEVLAKDVVFCFDRSGSMQGEKIAQARDALKFCLGSLNPEDRFGLLWFNDALDLHTTGMTTAGSASIDEALDAIDGINAEGGTFIYGALARALQLFETNDRPKYLVFLTDGLPTVGTTAPDAILRDTKSKNGVGARIFTFGVGYDLNAGLLNDLAEQNNGFSSYVAPEENVEVAVSNFFRKMSRPVLADCRLEFDRGIAVNDMYPPVLPDVFAGNEIVVYGRFLNEGEATARLLGNRGTTAVNHTFTAQFAPRDDQYPFIAKLWAGRRIGHLLDAMRTSGETAEVKDEVVRLSKRYGIMTPYTSFLAAPEEVRIAQGIPLPQEREAVIVRGRAQMVAPADQSATQRSIEASKLKGSHSSNALSAVPAPAMGAAAGAAGKEEAERDANVSGRRFTNLNGVWTDWDALNPKAPIADTIVVKPYSEAYFKLAENKDIAAILALGDRIIFLWDNVLIKLDESGAEKWNNNWPRL